MTSLKIKLLTSVLVAGFATSGAMAQTALPPAELHGAGASSIANVVPQALNCIGQPSLAYGPFTPGTSTTAPVYTPQTGPAPTPLTLPTGLNKRGNSTLSSSGNPNLTTITPFNDATIGRNCATTEIQPDFDGRYISSGSGGGKTWFTTGNKPGSINNPFPSGTNGFSGPAAFGNKPWTNIQFAFSDAPLSSTEYTTYNTSATTTGNNINLAGAPIQIPFLVLPVAVAYNPVYGVANINGTATPLKFRLKNPVLSGTTTIGGLRLSKAAYCGIFNGTITDFNDPILTALNGGQSLKDLADPRATFSVPIRLVGRSDKSGTTDITTRSLYAQCRSPNFTGTNYYQTFSETLPYRTTADVTASGGVAGPDMSSKDSGTELKPSSAAPHAGSTTRISGAFFNKATGLIETNLGSETPGTFLVANGNDGVAAAVNYQTTPATVGAVDLNGKVAYLSADFVLPSTITGTTLNSAALADPGAPTKYLMPSAKNATAAFGTVLPPESTSAGVYSVPDPRILVDSINGTHNASRTNSLDWLGVTHVPGLGSDGLATTDAPGSVGDPTKGYPLTGTTQLLTSTCFKDTANRFAMVEMMGAFIGKVVTDSANVAFSTNLFKGTSVPGVFAQNGVAPMPSAWIAAISETYLKKSTQSSGGATLGSKNLYIQSKLPTSTGTSGITSNPGCTAGAGA